MTIFVVDIWHAEIIIQSVVVITIKIIKSTAYWGSSPVAGCVQEMSENGGGGQLVVKARFNFKQNNEDELSFNKGELIHVTRQEEGGWWEGSFNGKTGWFLAITSERSSHVVSAQSKILSCIVRNIIKQVSPFLFSPEKPISPKAVKGLDCSSVD